MFAMIFCGPRLEIQYENKVLKKKLMFLVLCSGVGGKGGSPGLFYFA